VLAGGELPLAADEAARIALGETVA